MTTPTNAGLHIAASMTTPSRPGKQPRPVWTVTGNLAPWSSMLRHLGGRKYGRAFSFWTDPTDAITHALQTTAPDNYADQLAAKQDRAAARAERHTEWAEKADARSDTAYHGARAAVDGIPFGQPILVGHHSERGHRAALRRHDARMRRAVEEQQTADYHRGRAHAATRTASDEHPPAFCQRRITDAEATIRDVDRRIARTFDPSRADLYGHEGADGYRARLERVKAEAIEKRDYWRGKLTEAGGVRFTPDTIAPGDEVRPRAHAWARVVRCNPTTVSVTWDTGPLAGMGGKYPYAEIADHRAAGHVAAQEPTPCPSDTRSCTASKPATTSARPDGTALLNVCAQTAAPSPPYLPTSSPATSPSTSATPPGRTSDVTDREAAS